MPTYFYKAKNLKGEEESGVLAAQSPSHLARILRKKGYFLISAEEKGVGKKEKFKYTKEFIRRMKRCPRCKKTVSCRLWHYGDKMCRKCSGQITYKRNKK